MDTYHARLRRLGELATETPEGFGGALTEPVEKRVAHYLGLVDEIRRWAPHDLRIPCASRARGNLIEAVQARCFGIAKSNDPLPTTPRGLAEKLDPSLGAFVNAHWVKDAGPTAYRRALYRLQDADEAADVMQETLLAICTTPAEKLRFDWNAGGLARIIADRKAGEIVKRRRTISLDRLTVDADGPRQFAEKGPTTYERTYTSAWLDEFTRVFNSFKPEDREILLDSFASGLKNTEIARRFGITDTAVGSKLHRFRKRLSAAGLDPTP